jgi:hypothetical protein
VITEWIDKCAGNGVKVIAFSGAGEPLLNKAIIGHIQHAVRLGIIPFCYTSAALVDEPLAQRLRQAGLNEILVSLHGQDAGTHDALTGRPGSFHKTLNGLRILKRAGFQVMTNTVMTRSNLSGLEDLVDLARGRHQVDEMAFTFPELSESLALRTDIVPAYDTVKQPLENVLNKLAAASVPAIVENMPHCIISPGSYTPMLDLPAFYKDLNYDLAARPSAYGRKKVPRCSGCPSLKLCAGIDGNYPYDFDSPPRVVQGFTEQSAASPETF